MINVLEISKDREGHITVKEWLDTIRIQPQLLGEADPDFIETVITITASNGTERYRVTGCDHYGTLTAERIR